MRTATIFIITLLIGLSSASAGKKAGVTMPDTTTLAGKQLVLNGMGLREATVLGIDVYVAGLYLETKSTDPAGIITSDQNKLLVLRFVRDVDRSDIVKAWSEGFKNNATTPLAQIQPGIDQLVGWMPKFKNGDTLMFGIVPGKGVEVNINGTRKGVIEGDEFAHALVGIWLGPKPPTKDLKQGLIGKG